MLISRAWVFAYCSTTTSSLTAIQEKYQDQNFCIPLCISVSKVINSAGIYLFKVNNKNTRRMCEIELIKTSEQMTTSLIDFTNCSQISQIVHCCFWKGKERPLKGRHTFRKYWKVVWKNIRLSFSDSRCSYWGFVVKLVNENLEKLPNCHFHYRFSKILSRNRQLHVQR